jgi:hypothetical protein
VFFGRRERAGVFVMMRVYLTSQILARDWNWDFDCYGLFFVGGYWKALSTADGWKLTGLRLGAHVSS